MSLRIDLDRSIAAETRRIGHERVDDAIERLRAAVDETADPVEAVHQARKRCKELRAVARLVRPAIGDRYYRQTDHRFRDAARGLSESRDAHALAAAFDAFVADDLDAVSRPAQEVVRAELRRRAAAGTGRLTSDSALIGETIGELVAGKQLLDRWVLEGDLVDAVVSGCGATYRRGRRALDVVTTDPTPERFHELRKRAKYTWYHLRLLGDAAPGILEPLADRYHELSDTLGDAHDLAVLEGQLSDAPDEFGGAATVEETRRWLRAQRDELERRATSDARRLYAETGRRFEQRIGSYLTIALDERAAGAGDA